VPVHELCRVSVIDHFDGDWLAFTHSQERSGRGAVVAGGGDDVGAIELDRHGCDAEGVVGLAVGERGYIRRGNV